MSKRKYADLQGAFPTLFAFVALRHQRNAVNKELTPVDKEVKGLAGDAEIVRCGPHIILTRSERTSTEIDRQRLQTEYPEVWAAVTSTKTTPVWNVASGALDALEMFADENGYELTETEVG